MGWRTEHELGSHSGTPPDKEFPFNPPLGIGKVVTITKFWKENSLLPIRKLLHFTEFIFREAGGGGRELSHGVAALSQGLPRAFYVSVPSPHHNHFKEPVFFSLSVWSRPPPPASFFETGLLYLAPGTHSIDKTVLELI